MLTRAYQYRAAKENAQLADLRVMMLASFVDALTDSDLGADTYTEKELSSRVIILAQSEARAAQQALRSAEMRLMNLGAAGRISARDAFLTLENSNLSTEILDEVTDLIGSWATSVYGDDEALD